MLMKAASSRCEIWFPVWGGRVGLVGISGGGGEESGTICAGLCHLGIAGVPAQHQRWLGSESGCLESRASAGMVDSARNLLGSLQKLRAVWGHELQEVEGRSCTCSTGLGPGKMNVSRNFSSGRKKKKQAEWSWKEYFVKSYVCQIVSF